MAIIKEKNGTYKVDVSLGFVNGKRIRKRKKGIKKLKDAQKIEADFRKYDKNNTEIKKEKMSFTDAYSKYIEYCYIEFSKGNIRNTTINSKKCIFNIHIIPFFKLYLINDIKKEDILKFQEKLTTTINSRSRNKHLSNGTIRKIYKQLNVFFEYCLKEEIIYFNPCKRVANFKKEKKEKEYLTLEEFNKLIKQLNKKRDLAIAYLLFFSGIRVSELLGLNLDDITLNTESPYINICNTYYNGEIRPYAKTDASSGIVFLDETTQSILSDYIASDEFHVYNSNYLFPSNDSKCGIMTAKAVGNILKKASINANITKNITPHSFRHSHVAMLIDMGMNLEDIKDRVRHKSIRTTSDEYGHMYNSRKKELVVNITKYIKNHSN